MSSQPTCPQCDNGTLTKVKKNFWTNRNYYKCVNCTFEGDLPISTSGKFALWTLSVITMLVLISIISGNGGGIGIIGILTPMMLFDDYRKRKSINKYRNEHGLGELKNYPKESRGIFKGIVYSIIILTILFLISLLSASSESSASNSINKVTSTQSEIVGAEKPYYSTSGNFKINFPAYPTEETNSQVIGNIPVETSSYSTESKQDNIIYYVNVARYQVDPSDYDSKKGLDGALNGMINNSGSVLVSSNYSNFESYPSMDFELYNSSDSLYATGKNIIVGSTLYTIVTLSPESQSQLGTNFINSFELLSN